MFAFGPWETQPLDNQITYRKQAQKELMEQFDGGGHMGALQIRKFLWKETQSVLLNKTASFIYNYIPQLFFLFIFFFRLPYWPVCVHFCSPYLQILGIDSRKTLVFSLFKK